MPIVPTWTNDEDYLKYLEVKKGGSKAWTEFIHKALNPNLQKLDYDGTTVLDHDTGLVHVKPNIKSIPAMNKETIGKSILANEQAISSLERACCAAKKLCQHWIWDETKALYINSLSGREREIE